MLRILKSLTAIPQEDIEKKCCVIWKDILKQRICKAREQINNLKILSYFLFQLCVFDLEYWNIKFTLINYGKNMVLALFFCQLLGVFDD